MQGGSKSMNETLFDEVLANKKEPTRHEKISIMALIHKVPKQVADTAQTQGVSEKLLESGMPSGVITPSQLSHDRFLSVMDAFQDVLYISIFLTVIPLMSVNLFNITLITLFLLYWIFHIAWWQKAKVWYIKPSVIKYIKQTYNFYWITTITLAIGSLYLSFKYVITGTLAQTFIDLSNITLSMIARIEHALATFTEKKPELQGWLDPEAHYHLLITPESYINHYIMTIIFFILLTGVSKWLLAGMYNKERNYQIKSTQDELSYASDRALETLAKI